MKFKFAHKKADTYLLKIILDDDKEKWAETSEAVYNYAKNNFKEDEECGFEYTVKDSKYTVSRILKDGKSTKTEDKPKTEEMEEKMANTCQECGKFLKDDKYKLCYVCNQKNKSSAGGEIKTQGKPTCSDCGKELKDSKYTKCYTCNQKSPAKPSGGSGGKNQDLIVRQAIMKCATQAVVTLTGQISDTGTLCEIVETIYTRLLKKIYE